MSPTPKQPANKTHWRVDSNNEGVCSFNRLRTNSAD